MSDLRDTGIFQNDPTYALSRKLMEIERKEERKWKEMSC